MNKIINYLKCYGIYFTLLICYLIIISLFYYFEVFNYKTISIINFIVNIVLFFILGLNISKKEKSKGYLNGFIISSILILFFTLISLIISKLNLTSLVYYLTLIISSVTGGIIGVTKK